jgi:hypothetical protein
MPYLDRVLWNQLITKHLKDPSKTRDAHNLEVGAGKPPEKTGGQCEKIT